MAKAEIIKITTPPFVAAFPSVFEKSAYDGSAEKYSIVAIWTPKLFGKLDRQYWAKLKDELERQAQEGLKKKWESIALANRGLRNGTEKPDVEGFGEGTMFATLSTQIQPPVVALDGTPITDPDEIYPGAICRAKVNVYFYNNKSKGVAIGLRSLQKVKDGPRIDGRSNEAADFDEMDDSWLEEHTDSMLNDNEGDDDLGI